ncbi:MAG: trypsin-like peptidase domain-containing protein [Microcoleaceae cyanobacterium]
MVLNRALERSLNRLLSGSLNHSIVPAHGQILAGIATVAIVAFYPAASVAAKTAQEIAEIAAPVTVQVNSALGDGSGVIIARVGKTYTVLTVNHVVEDAETPYTLRTAEGEDYPATQVIRLQTDDTEPDLAILQFESEQDYEVATLGDSEQTVIGTQIYVYGYPATGGLTGVEREPELSPGLVTSRPKSRPEGYNLRYQAVTWSGMSGGPVFDAEGRVVGLHGQGEFGFAQTSSGDVAPIKTGFNAAVPINLFVNQLSAAQLTPDNLQIDQTPVTLSSVQLDDPKSAQEFYFRGLTYLDQEIPLEAINDFNRAIALDNNVPEFYFGRGLARTLIGMREPTRSPNPIADYTEAIRINPGYADAYYNRGLAYANLKQFEKAIADLEAAAELYRQLGREGAYQETLQQIQRFQNLSADSSPNSTFDKYLDSLLQSDKAEQKGI